MTRLTLPRKLKHPQAAQLQLDPRFPKPSFLYDASLGSFDFMNPQRRGTKGASDTAFVPSGDYVSYQTADATNAGLDFGTMQATTSELVTVIAVAKAASGAGICTLFSQRTSTGNFQQLDLLLNSNGSLAANAGGFAFVSYSAAFNSVHTGSGKVDGEWHTYGAVRKSGSSVNTDLWLDGVKQSVTNTGGSIGPAVASGQKVRIGNLGDYTTDANFVGVANIAFIVLWNGIILPDALMEVLTRNPRQILKTQQHQTFFTVGGGPTYTLTASQGSFSLTGVASSLLASRILTGSSGTFNLTGNTTSLLANRVLATQVGSFTLDGKTVNLLFNRVLSGSTGSFTLTGNVANLVYTPTGGATYTISAETGTFNLSGQLASLLASRKLTADVGDFDLIGNDAGLYVVVPGSGPILYLDLISGNILLLKQL